MTALQPTLQRVGGQEKSNHRVGFSAASAAATVLSLQGAEEAGGGRGRPGAKVRPVMVSVVDHGFSRPSDCRARPPGPPTLRPARPGARLSITLFLHRGGGHSAPSHGTAKALLKLCFGL